MPISPYDPNPQAPGGSPSILDAIYDFFVRKGNKMITAVSVGTSAVLLSAAKDRREITFENNGTQTLYLGETSTITSTTGTITLPAGATYTDYGSKDDWYGVTASSTTDTRVIEVV